MEISKQTLTIEAGKFYRTREGQKAFVAGIVPGMKTDWPIMGWIIAGARNVQVIWHLDGSDGGKNDLVAEWVEPKRIKGKMFICQSASGTFGSYISDEPRDPLGAKIIACIEIDVLEGAGLGEAA